MREIKFRAWDTATKKYAATGFHVIGEVTMFSLIDQYANENAVDGKSHLERLGDFKLEQFTGLLDKNGKEIYEGDIVTQTTTYPTGRKLVNTHEVTFDRCSFSMGNYSLGAQDYAELKIIGNKWENPELLKN